MKKTNQNHLIQEAQHDNHATDANQENYDDKEEKPEQCNETEMPTNNNETNGESNAKETSDPIMEIEGIVHGEADNNVVQSASRFSAVDDEENKV